MPIFTKHGFSGDSGSFVVSVRFDKRAVSNACLIELLRSSIELMFALDTKDDKMRML